MSVVALVPARAGSRRIPGKNTRQLAGHPLLAYTVAAARASNVFSHVVVSTDSEEIAAIARHYGAVVPGLRPAELAGPTSPDIGWVQHSVDALRDDGIDVDVFSILRPTSPLRHPETIQRAWREFEPDLRADSLRAIERCRQHPAKMWLVDGPRMAPLLDDDGRDPPWHSTPYQALPEVYVQNASLEIARVRVLDVHGTISGEVIRPFLCEDHEGFDLNDPEDWWVLERLIAEGIATLPEVTTEPFEPTERPSHD